MISDHDTNIVYVSDLLPKGYPDVAKALAKELGEKLRTIPGGKDIWCRDYMPIQVSPDRFVQFRYFPDYLKKYPHLRTEDGGKLLGIDTIQSDLVIDGGNVVRWNDAAILTRKIEKENRGIACFDLEARLRTALEIERLVIIPVEPEDKIGHSDGMVRFVDGRTVLVNDYGSIDSNFGKGVNDILKRMGLESIPFPYCPTNKVIDGIPSAEGVYINFLQINGLIVCPTFGYAEDDEALGVLEKCFPQYRIVSLRCEKLAEKGGVLNCATWNIVL